MKSHTKRFGWSICVKFQSVHCIEHTYPNVLGVTFIKCIFCATKVMYRRHIRENGLAQNDTYQQSNFSFEGNWRLAEELIACPI